MADIMVNFTIDESLKKSVEFACQDMGLSIDEAFTLFARKISKDKRMPFDVPEELNSKFEFICFNITSADTTRSVEFYKKLGLRLTVEYGKPGEKSYSAAFALGDAEEPRLWIWPIQDRDKDYMNNQLTIEFRENKRKMSDVYDEFIASGLLCDPPGETGYNMYDLTLYDPDGNLVYFVGNLL